MRKKGLVFFLCCFVCNCLTIFPSYSWAQVAYLQTPIQVLQPRYTINTTRPTNIPQEVLLKFKNNLPNTQIFAVYAKYGLQEISYSPYSGIRRCYVLSGIPLVIILDFLKAEPTVFYAEPNWIGEVNLIPNDLFFTYQWHLGAMNMNLAWDVSVGSGVIVAVLDTGVAHENFDIYALAPDLAGTSFVPGYDFVNDDPNPDDDEGHGTHITGTIAQTTNNLLGCAGGAFGASIMPVKVMDNSGNGNLTDIVDGIYFAVNNGAYILNLSLGFGDNPSLALEEAVNYAVDNGCLVICSAGNYSTDLPNYPAAYPASIAVSGVRYDRLLGDYSNYGTYIDLCAPGGDLTVDQNFDGYPDGILQQSHDGQDFQNFGFFLGRGTSWAAANVSAVAALVFSAGGGALTSADVRSILETSAQDLGTIGWDEYYGWGVVDAFAAVNKAITVSSAQVLGNRIALANDFFPLVTPAIQPFSFTPSVWGNQLNFLSLAPLYSMINFNERAQNFSLNKSITSGLNPVAKISGLGIEPFSPGIFELSFSYPDYSQTSYLFPSLFSFNNYPLELWALGNIFFPFSNPYYNFY